MADLKVNALYTDGFWIVYIRDHIPNNSVKWVAYSIETNSLEELTSPITPLAKTKEVIKERYSLIEEVGPSFSFKNIEKQYPELFI